MAGKVKNFACPSCGASMLLRNLSSLSAVCATCGAVIDTQNENYRILEKYYGAVRGIEPELELGSRATLFGHKWEVIGFIVREDLASAFAWDEYLLFNPYQGYRWLTNVDGHWSFVRSIKGLPELKGLYAYYKKKKYRIFNKGKARVRFVLGEFYWKLRADDKVELADYICPPLMISSEKNASEMIWSQGEYLDSKIVAKEFKLKALREPRSIGANQVSPKTITFKKVQPWWIGFIILLTFMELGHCCSSTNKTALSQTFQFKPNATGTVTSNVFALEKNNANLELDFGTPCDNSWLWISGELVNNDSGLTYPFERSVEYYHGYEGGESWSEGSTVSDLLLPAIPGGKYYLNMDFESGSFRDNNDRIFTVRVVRDVPTYANYFWCLFFISCLPIWYWIGSHADESKRWSNSDYSPYSSD